MPKTIWITKTGARVKIREMSDQHLANTINFLRRNAHAAQFAAIDSGYACLCSLNGEMAQYYCEQDINRIESMSTEDFLEESIEQWPYLLAEAERRQKLYEKTITHGGASGPGHQRDGRAVVHHKRTNRG